MKHFIQSFWLPLACPCCKTQKHLNPNLGVCKKCYIKLQNSALSFKDKIRCSLCGASPLISIEEEAKQSCKKEYGFCQGRKYFFDGILSLYALNKEWKKLVRAWKFEGNRFLYKNFLPQIDANIEYLKELKIDRIGIISSEKNVQNIRSFQPCLDLSMYIAKKLNVTFGIDIYKIKSFQQSQKTYEQRFFSIHNSLAVNETSLPKKNISNNYLLLEDVYTSGSTSNEAARVLKKFGVNKVFVYSMLRAGG